MDGKYSFLRYSLGSPERDVESALRCTGNLNVVAGAAVLTYSSSRFTAALQGKVLGSVAVISLIPANGELFVNVRMSANILAEMRRAEFLWPVAYACKNVCRGVFAQEALGAKILACKDIPLLISVVCALFSEAAGSKDVSSALSGQGVLNSLPSATSQTTDTTRVLLTIPPGGELRLNSDVFTAMLNGENVLYAQNGDWITLSDKTLRLLVESVSGGGLEGQLIYTERYL